MYQFRDMSCHRLCTTLLHWQPANGVVFPRKGLCSGGIGRLKHYNFTANALGGDRSIAASVASNDSSAKVITSPSFVVGRAAGRIAPSEERKYSELSRSKRAGGVSRRATVNVAKLLTSTIAAANTLEQLHDIVAAHGSRLDHIHVAKLLSRISQLVAAQQQQQQHTASSALPGQQQQLDQHQQLEQQKQQEQQQLLCSTLTVMMVQRLRHASPQSLVAAIAALGRLASLRHSSSSSSSAAAFATPQQLQQLASRAHDLASGLSASQLSVTLWGLAKVGLKPSISWLGHMLEAFMQQYKVSQEQQQQRQKQQEQKHQQQKDQRLQRPSLPGTAKQQLQPQQLLPDLAPLSAVPHHHSLATDLAMVLYALAVMGKHPNAAWLQQWQAAWLQQLPSANPQDLSQVLWGFSSLGLHPEQEWLEAVLTASEPMLPSAGSHALSNMIWAVARFNAAPTASWLESFLQALYDTPAVASNPQAATACLASLARLKVSVDPSWLSSTLDSSIDTLPSFTPWQLTNLCWATASLNHKPSPSWLRKFLGVTARLADARKFTVNQLGSIIWSLALMRSSGAALLASQQLQLQVMLQAIAAANGGTGLQQLGPGGRSGLAWALATLGMVPSKQWLGEYLAVAFDGGLAGDQLRCANVLFCIASLDFEYLVEWLGDFLAGEGAGGSGGLDLGLEKYAALAGVLAALSEMDSRQLRAAWLDLSSTEWSPETAAGDGLMGFSMQLPPSLATWVDSMLTSPPAQLPAAADSAANQAAVLVPAAVSEAPVTAAAAAVAAVAAAASGGKRRHSGTTPSS